MADDETARDVGDAAWRNRFLLMFAAQIGGTIIALFGIVWWQTDYVVPGGSIWGFPMALVGIFISFFAPRMLAKRWKRLDR